MITSKSPYNLDLTKVSSQNQRIFDLMVNSYNGLMLNELEFVIDNLDLNLLESDVQILYGQIKQLIQEIGIETNQKIIDYLNKSVTASHYTKIHDILAAIFKVSDPRICQTIIPRLMEINNLNRVLQDLNQLPSTKGQAINLIQIPSFK